jgi:hypothetical protein
MSSLDRKTGVDTFELFYFILNNQNNFKTAGHIEKREHAEELSMANLLLLRKGINCWLSGQCSTTGGRLLIQSRILMLSCWHVRLRLRLICTL